MGNVASRTIRTYKYKNDRRILFLGLSGSGKSYIFFFKYLNRKKFNYYNYNIIFNERESRSKYYKN